MDNKKTIETQRLILRPFKLDDAESLYIYASSYEVASNAGWRAHDSIEYSKKIISMIYQKSNSYAITIKNTGNSVVGAITLYTGESKVRGRGKNDADLGYWIGMPFQNKGYVTEAVYEVVKECFLHSDKERIWCSYYKGNNASKRVMEKNGFKFDHIAYGSINPMLGGSYTEIFYLLEKKYFMRNQIV